MCVNRWMGAPGQKDAMRHRGWAQPFHGAARLTPTAERTPFNRGQSGPGGWIILHEPELHLAAEIVVPDVAGWRRSTLPELPDSAFFSVRPDWAAEVLSPATQRTDRTLKVPLYRAQGVSHVWLVDPVAQTVEVYRLHAEGYILVGTHGGEGLLSIEPFDAIEFDVGALWQR
jgi:Uma2 family endonuclease